MNIISHFKQILENNFNNFIKSYFEQSNYWNKSYDINNYINFMQDLDSFNYSLITDIIKSYFEYVDDIFFNSSYRHDYCISKGFYDRTILTLFGEVTYKNGAFRLLQGGHKFVVLIVQKCILPSKNDFEKPI